ncbi:PD-(D/E)XK motif protein [Pseudomonas anatoliensis]|uniref:PD-(D/E)XK motif protein n=1 Tax=Pseudomonas anatoliensis TaxID=2710589 RepID=UPI001B321AA3|nr:PD-(D/E)XK motif protein [Pseudomonas anatoliensis]MBP5955507.1 PD-(D/E)XK motif protein [Pseudomonas anatoliensis]
MSSDFSGKWDEISTLGYEAGRFRVCPDHLIDLFVGFSVAREREFTFESSITNFEAEEIPDFENLEVHLTDDRGRKSLTLRLMDRGLTDLFSIICCDLAEASSVATTESGAIRIFVVRLSRWAELLRRRRANELSFKERLGLLGELNMLVWAIEECGVDAMLAVRGWRGPEGDTNDIGLNNLRIEVKAQLSTQRQSLKISSLDQLNWDGRNLYIAANRFSPSDQGLSLESLSADIFVKLATNRSGVMEFQRKLILAGYDSDASYAGDTYNLEKLSLYRVTENFPRLVPSNVPHGVTKVSYEVSCELISDFLVPPSELVGLIND